MMYSSNDFCCRYSRLCPTLFLLSLAACVSSQATAKSVNSASTPSDFSDLSAPHEVFVEAITSNSVTLSWKAPPPPLDPKVKLSTYSLVFTPVSSYDIDLEREFSLAPNTTSKQVTGLKEGFRYVVLLSAVYGDLSQRLSRDRLRRVAAPKFTISIPATPIMQQDMAIAENGLPVNETECNCSKVGMYACTRRIGFQSCACNAGYTGTYCEQCAPGNFRAKEECKLCPCTNITSTAECQIDAHNQVTCTQCLPGHRGSLCTSCTAGYHWSEDHCLPLNCLSSSLCAEQRNAPGCEDCIFQENYMPPTAHRSNSDRGIADGTLPLIAVVVTLGVLLLVAAMATCYRYWNHRRHQPRIPFWSIELQDDKSDLHTHCHYQHLDAATNKVVHACPEEANGGNTGEVGRLTTEPTPRTYNTINV